jgi:hypothetical protein
MIVPSTTPGLLGRVRAWISQPPRTHERWLTRRFVRGSLLAAVLAISIGAVTMFGHGVSTASAGSSEEIRTSGAWAKFDDLGEKLLVGDIAKDGKGTRAYLHWPGGNSASVRVAGYAKPLDERDLSIREGTKVTLTADASRAAGRRRHLSAGGRAVILQLMLLL